MIRRVTAPGALRATVREYVFTPDDPTQDETATVFTAKAGMLVRFAAAIVDAKNDVSALNVGDADDQSGYLWVSVGADATLGALVPGTPSDNGGYVQKGGKLYALYATDTPVTVRYEANGTTSPVAPLVHLRFVVERVW